MEHGVRKETLMSLTEYGNQMISPVKGYTIGLDQRNKVLLYHLPTNRREEIEAELWNHSHIQEASLIFNNAF